MNEAAGSEPVPPATMVESIENLADKMFYIINSRLNRIFFMLSCQLKMQEIPF